MPRETFDTIISELDHEEDWRRTLGRGFIVPQHHGVFAPAAEEQAEARWPQIESLDEFLVPQNGDERVVGGE